MQDNLNYEYIYLHSSNHRNNLICIWSGSDILNLQQNFGSILDLYRSEQISAMTVRVEH